MATIDIAIPNYNYGLHLEACIRSVQSQGVDDIRILVIDNASTDDSVAIVRRLMAHDPRIALLARETNLGVHASLNAFLDWAEGTFCLMLCADDILAPDFLRRALALMQAHPTAAFCYGIEVPFRTGEALPETPIVPAPAPVVMAGQRFIEDRFRQAERIISCGTVLCRTALQKRIGAYRTELRMTLDLEFLLRLAETGDVIFSNDRHAFRRQHGANYSAPLQASPTADLIERGKALQWFLDHEGRALPDRDALAHAMQRRLAARAYWWGLRDLVAGRLARAAVSLRYAFALAPAMAVLPPLDFLLREDGPVRRLSGGAPAR
jgi:glycosyltransferase involved in cell wall biosynthesis